MEANDSMRPQDWINGISDEKRQISLLMAYCVAVGGWTLRIFPDPRNEAQGLTIFEWIYRKAEMNLKRAQ